MKEKIKQFIKKYYPDIIILIGIWILSYNVLRQKEFGNPFDLNLDITRYYTNEKVLGIMLIAIGIDIAIRKYLIYKKSK